MIIKDVSKVFCIQGQILVDEILDVMTQRILCGFIMISVYAYQQSFQTGTLNLPVADITVPVFITNGIYIIFCP